MSFDKFWDLCQEFDSFTYLLKANIGQNEDFDAAETKAMFLGAKKVRQTYSVVYSFPYSF